MARALAATLAGVATVAMLLLGSPSVAADDTRPVATEPATHEVLARPPAAVTLAFRWDIDPDQARIFVLDAKGKNITSAVPSIDGNNVWVDLDYGLEKGTYTVEYRVNGPEGTPVGGTYQFAVGSSGKWKNIKDPYWSGSDDQPEVFKGGDPNNPYDKDKESESDISDDTGVEIVREDGTVESPQGSDADQTDKDSSTHSPKWLYGAGAVAVVVAITSGLWWWKRRTRTPAPRGGRRAAR